MTTRTVKTPAVAARIAYHAHKARHGCYIHCPVAHRLYTAWMAAARE